MNTNVTVTVGDGGSVLCGVGVDVVVGGAFAAVIVNAAFAVCAMIVLIAFGSVVGNGVAPEGAHAMIKINIANQTNKFCLRIRSY